MPTNRKGKDSSKNASKRSSQCSSSSSKPGATETRSKHLVTDSAEDVQDRTNIETLKSYYNRLKEIEDTANNLKRKGDLKEAGILIEKAKQTKLEIEAFLKETKGHRQALEKAYEASYEQQIQKLVDSNFSSPSELMIKQAKTKGLDLTKISFQIMMTEMCKEMLEMKHANKIRLRDCFPQLNQPVAVTTSKSTSTSPLKSQSTSSNNNNSSSSGNKTNGTSTTTSTTNSTNEEVILTAPELNLFANDAWFSDEFLERVMFKVRKRESREMATRIVDEISLPCLRMMLMTRVLYQDPTSTTDGNTVTNSSFINYDILNNMMSKDDKHVMNDNIKTPLASDNNTTSTATTTSSTTTATSTTTLTGTSMIKDEGNNIISTPWKIDTYKNNVVDMIKSQLLIIGDLEKASRTQLSTLIIDALTEDIFELEVQQLITANLLIQELKNNNNNNNNNNNSGTTTSTTTDDKKRNMVGTTTTNNNNHNNHNTTNKLNKNMSIRETQKLIQMQYGNEKAELDSHGDRVYNMMIMKYGNGFENIYQNAMKDFNDHLLGGILSAVLFGCIIFIVFRQVVPLLTMSQ